jgi:hypothetical protein
MSPQINDAFIELLCISEIMQSLAEKAAAESERLPAPWMKFFGERICEVADRISASPTLTLRVTS